MMRTSTAMPSSTVLALIGVFGSLPLFDRELGGDRHLVGRLAVLAERELQVAGTPVEHEDLLPARSCAVGVDLNERVRTELHEAEGAARNWICVRLVVDPVSQGRPLLQGSNGFGGEDDVDLSRADVLVLFGTVDGDLR